MPVTAALIPVTVNHHHDPGLASVIIDSTTNFKKFKESIIDALLRDRHPDRHYSILVGLRGKPDLAGDVAYTAQEREILWRMQLLEIWERALDLWEQEMQEKEQMVGEHFFMASRRRYHGNAAGLMPPGMLKEKKRCGVCMEARSEGREPEFHLCCDDVLVKNYRTESGPVKRPGFWLEVR